MSLYYLTTLLILAWCLVITVAWTAVAYLVAARKTRDLGSGSSDGNVSSGMGVGFVVPGLVLAPVILVLSFRALRINLLFPSAFEANAAALSLAAIAPATVLFVTSGLAGNLWRTVRSQYEHWHHRPFATAALASGLTRDQAIRRLVLVGSFLSAWSECLAWLYGELIIVEAVFNAPGLGLATWQSARERDFAGLVATLGALILIYGLTLALSHAASRWLGRRLESYA